MHDYAWFTGSWILTKNRITTLGELIQAYEYETDEK